MQPTPQSLLRLLRVQRATGGTSPANAAWWEREIRALAERAPDESAEPADQQAPEAGTQPAEQHHDAA